MERRTAYKILKIDENGDLIITLSEHTEEEFIAKGIENIAFNDELYMAILLSAYCEFIISYAE